MAITLLARWKCDETSGITLADTTGNYPATLMPNSGGNWTGGTLGVAGKFGAAASFNGTSGGASTAASGSTIIGPATALTMACWANSTSYASDKRMLAFANSTGGTVLGLPVGRASGKFSAFCRSSAGALIQIDSASTYSSGWHHVAVTIAGTTATLYVDGGTGATATASASQSLLADTAAGILIASSGGVFYPGLLDDIRIYSGAATQAEIQTIMLGDVGGPMFARRRMAV